MQLTGMVLRESLEQSDRLSLVTDFIGKNVVHIYVCRYICLWTIESHFSNRLTLSNIHDGISHQIYRLALSLSAPETLSSE